MGNDLTSAEQAAADDVLTGAGDLPVAGMTGPHDAEQRPCPSGKPYPHGYTADCRSDVQPATIRPNAPLIPDVTGFNDQTLMKVREGLTHALGITGQQVTDTISVLQNHGILFREPIENKGGASDGYHTFDELYEHRRALTAVLATIATIQDDAWRTKAHHPDDNPIYDGYFIVGIELPDGPVSYHYPLAHWDEFSAVPEVDHAPRWDGHTDDVVVDRLHGFASVLAQAVAERNASDAEEAASAEHPPKPCDCDACRSKRAREEAQANAAEAAATEGAPAE